MSKKQQGLFKIANSSLITLSASMVTTAGWLMRAASANSIKMTSTKTYTPSPTAPPGDTALEIAEAYPWILALSAVGGLICCCIIKMSIERKEREGIMRAAGEPEHHNVRYQSFS